MIASLHEAVQGVKQTLENQVKFNQSEGQLRKAKDEIDRLSDLNQKSLNLLGHKDSEIQRLCQESSSRQDRISSLEARLGRALRAILGSVASDIEYIPPPASSVASPRSSLVESADRSCVKAATSGQGSARFASTVLAQTSAIVLAGLMADSGRYAAEAAGSSRWDPETSAEVAQAARVREFREQYHLLDDADFAYAFRSAEEATLAGGRGLAEAWAKARAEQAEELMPLAASTVEAGSSRSSRDRPTPSIRLPAPPVPVRKGVTLSQQAFSAESVNRRVEALAKASRMRSLLSGNSNFSDWRRSK